MNRRVDQKLHLARLTLALIPANPTAAAALAEAALFHLSVAYRAYLREILEHFKLSVSIGSAQQVAELLRAQDLHSADLDELVKLEQSGEWPAQLCEAYAEASRDMVREPVANKTSSVNTPIVLRDVTAHIDVKVCMKWLQEFHALLQRQREHAQEL